MNCRDFDQTWNRLLDDEPQSRRRGTEASRPDLENRLRDHAAACEDCRERQIQFETLRRALRAWAEVAPGPEPLLLVEPVERPAGSPRRRGRPRIVAGSLAAAAAIVAVMIGTLGPSLHPVAEVEPISPVEPPPRAGLLRAAVDDATAASWRLARLATEPAARLGGEMIDASFPRADEPPALEIALLEPSPTASAWSTPEVLSRMSGHLIAGVEPVSTSAREAFGFLRSPAPQ